MNRIPFLRLALIILVPAIALASIALTLVSATPEAAAPILAPPSRAFPLGTDRAGHNMIPQTLLALAYSLGQIAVAGTAAFAAGVAAGCVSGIGIGRWPDQVFGLVVELIRAFPAVLLLLLLAALGLSGPWVLAIYFAAPIWRVARTEFIHQAEMPYFLNALLRNRSRWKSFMFELLPNVVPSVLQYLPVVLADMLSIQVAIEFLGFGPPPPQASMGALILETIELGTAAPWVWLPTTVIMVVLVIAGALISNRIAQTV